MEILWVTPASSS